MKCTDKEYPPTLEQPVRDVANVTSEIPASGLLLKLAPTRP